MTAPIRYDGAVRLSPLVQRVTQQNPGLFTGPGTNTHLVGDTTLFILDPGEDKEDGHLERILAAVGQARVAAVIPSHGHPDHWPLAPRLARATGAPIWFFGSHEGFVTDRSLRDDDVVSAGGVTLTVLHTPGHTRDHVSFHVPKERALFPGDLVMGWSTSIIAPPDGDLRQYLASLDRVLAIPDLLVLYPAHGEAVTAPYQRTKELAAHRQERTRQVIEALSQGPSRIDALVERIYVDVDRALHPAAAQSLFAHLLALEAEGKVRRVSGGETTSWDRVEWELESRTRS